MFSPPAFLPTGNNTMMTALVPPRRTQSGGNKMATKRNNAIKTDSGDIGLNTLADNDRVKSRDGGNPRDGAVGSFILFPGIDRTACRPDTRALNRTTNIA